MSSERGPNTADRELPGGKTLAAALQLLDPRSGESSELESRRRDFEGRLATLVPDPSARASLGVDSLLQWHVLYARRREALARALADLRGGTAKVMGPGDGFETRIDGAGQARICAVTSRDPAAAPDEGACRRVPGLRQLDQDFLALDAAVSDVLEAQWFVVTTLDSIRVRLDPTATISPIEAALPLDRKAN